MTYEQSIHNITKLEQAFYKLAKTNGSLAWTKALGEFEAAKAAHRAQFGALDQFMGAWY